MVIVNAYLCPLKGWAVIFYLVSALVCITSIPPLGEEEKHES
jgi:hypothetical protein